jgi:hypothetical protein
LCYLRVVEVLFISFYTQRLVRNVMALMKDQKQFFDLNSLVVTKFERKKKRKQRLRVSVWRILIGKLKALSEPEATPTQSTVQ